MKTTIDIDGQLDRITLTHKGQGHTITDTSALHDKLLLIQKGEYDGRVEISYDNRRLVPGLAATYIEEALYTRGIICTHVNAK